MRIEVETRIYRWSVLCLLLSGLVYVQWGQMYERILFIISTILCLASIRNFAIVIKNKYYLSDIFFALCIAGFCLDSLLYCTIRPIMYGLGLLFTYIMLQTIFVRHYYKNGNDILKLNYKILIIFSLSTYLIGLAKVGIYFPLYKGNFGNSNTMGIFAASACSVIVAKLIYKFDVRKKIYLIEIVTLTISIIFTFLSWSRIAMLSVLTALSLFMLNLMKTHSNGKIAKRKLLALLCCIIIVFFSFDTVYDVFISKFTMLSNPEGVWGGDISNGRSALWRMVWDKAGLFGNGEDLMTIKAAHNVYFGLANSYGKIVAFLFLAFVILTFIESFIFMKKVNCRFEWKYLPALCSIVFLYVSMTENYLMTYPMLMMFISRSIVRRYM